MHVPFLWPLVENFLNRESTSERISCSHSNGKAPHTNCPLVVVGEIGQGNAYRIFTRVVPKVEHPSKELTDIKA